MPSFPLHPSESARPLANADSFAMAFDDAWRLQRSEPEVQSLGRSELLERILSQLAEHPFAQKDGATAREVGEFRLRLHGV
ncbi:MAG: hypothetical protein ACKOOH_07760 [Cyanobium sp.]